MKRIKLDKIDRKILKNLQSNGRITNVELAKLAGISAPPCLRRVRALEEAGYITGYCARVDAPAMGYAITVFANIKLTSHVEGDITRFEENVKVLPNVRESYRLAGETDILLKIVARDWNDYQAFLTEKLNGVPNIASIKSSLVAGVAKEECGVPIEV